MSTILALDIASKTGWACGEPGAIPSSGAISLARPGDAAGRVGARLHEWLCNWITDVEPILVAIEAPIIPSARSRAGSRLLVGLAQIAATVCDVREVAFLEVACSTARLNFCGSGRASKEDVQAECRRRGWYPDTPDAADACAVWAWAAETVAPRIIRQRAPA